MSSGKLHRGRHALAELVELQVAGVKFPMVVLCFIRFGLSGQQFQASHAWLDAR